MRSPICSRRPTRAVRLGRGFRLGRLEFEYLAFERPCRAVGLVGEQFAGEAEVVRWIPLDARAVGGDELGDGSEDGPLLREEQRLDLGGAGRNGDRDASGHVSQRRGVRVGLEGADDAIESP